MVNDLHFKSQPWWPRVHVCANLVIPAQIHDELFYAEKVKFIYKQANRWTDGQTKAMKLPLQPEKPKGLKQLISIIIITGVLLMIFIQNLVHIIESFLHKHTWY